MIKIDISLKNYNTNCSQIGKIAVVKDNISLYDDSILFTNVGTWSDYTPNFLGNGVNFNVNLDINVKNVLNKFNIDNHVFYVIKSDEYSPNVKSYSYELEMDNLGSYYFIL